jgi:hypothetical protein
LVAENILQNRYGYGRTRKKDLVLAVTVAIVSVVGFLVWGILFSLQQANQVTTRDVGFTVIDQYSTEVIFEVSRNPGQEVVCEVEVLNPSFAVVGYKKVPVSASEGRSVVISTVVNTTELGTSGLVAGCR